MSEISQIGHFHPWGWTNQRVNDDQHPARKGDVGEY
jgi:hypothetical protein